MNPVHAEVAKNIRNVVVVRKPFVISGFKVGAVECGMRYKNRLDLALIVSEGTEGVPCAAVFTRNIFSAAPVEVSKNHLKLSGGNVNAVLVNAGIANACTGREGIRLAEISCELVANRLGVSKDRVIMASTGVIGPLIDVDKITGSLDSLIKDLAEDRWDDFAKAIMTTDTVPKLSFGRIEMDSLSFSIGGVTKGSGMIAPDMATMLAFLCTDVYVPQSMLQEFLQEAVDKSFNCITVDGDTSTNDMVVLLARGKNCEKRIEQKNAPEALVFKHLLEKVCEDLAKQIVEDGEGATKFVEIHVTGAPCFEDAKRMAKCIAESPLVKTAFYGADANWGRVVAAAGRSGVSFDPGKVSLYFDDLCVFKNGVPLLDEYVEEKASSIFRKTHFTVKLDLNSGEYDARVWTCDLSHGYVDINASYRT